MKIYFYTPSRILILSSFLIHSSVSQGQTRKYDPELKLWYDRPASVWEEALPLGNAKTGAMVFGGVGTERYQLNDNTLWSGFPDPGNNPDAPKILPLVRKAVFEGNYDSASELWKKMQGPYSARYLPLGDLLLKSHSRDTTPMIYYRDLDLNNATARVTYTTNTGITYNREVFISFPDKVMVIHITSSKRGGINFNAALTSRLRYRILSVSDDYVVMKGKAPKYVATRDAELKQVEYDDNPAGEGMNFEVHLRILTENGLISNSNGEIVIKGADAVTIYLTEGTSFNGFNKSPGLAGKDASAEPAINLQKAISKPYASLLQNHISDYQTLFDRVDLNLGFNAKTVMLPTDQRLQRFNSIIQDNQLQVLYYQFGRYLMIASSRPGSRPTNLQGIWNQHVQPPWGSNYTTNINTEMNYWPAENTNLSECHMPLFDFMRELAINGAVTAKTNYNINEGWVTHHNSDLWAKTSPPGGYEADPRSQSRWSCWQMAGAWFSTHLWEHYLYTGDQQFLKEKAYPLMKGAAQFLLHWMVEDPKTHFLVTNPSTSPENTIKIKGQEYQLTMASTMDMSIIRELFDALIKTTRVLNIDPAFRSQLTKAYEKLYPFHIGKFGQLQEWFDDWDDPNDKHRHISHLFGLYPGSQITLNVTPELASAAKQTLIHRGDVSTGWSMAWKINWWARLQDGEHAYKILSAAFTYIDPKAAKETMGGGGTYPNLFDAHPPFQIDGNFGATAGITEMLMQSHEGFISLLPALPSAWETGYIKGIKSRGNFTVDIEWKDGKLLQSKIFSGSGGNCRIRSIQPVKVIEVKSVTARLDNSNPLLTVFGKPPYRKNGWAKLEEVKNEKGFVIDFITQKGRTYTLVPL